MAFVVGEIAAPITADPSQFNQAMEDIEAKGEEVCINIGAQWGSLSKKMEKVGKSLTKYVTTPIIGAGALSIKSAIDFESAFAGVRKTVDATGAQFAALEEGIRSMAQEIPAAATEIAGVAEAAGQLGIETDNILGFTRTMIDLGEATNLSATDAATALARLANITQMPQTEFDRLGSTIVALGNNLATTEAEIVEMGLRLAGAGKQVGMSEAEILSLAGALSSVGIEAEAGGSAFSRVMAQMQLATETGGQALTDFASVAGMSADEFRQAFQEDAASAIISFIEGLGNAEDRGTSAIKVLDDMGITEIRLRDALLRAAGAGDLFNESIKIGTTAWKENVALTKEAQQRYETTASQLQILRNNIYEVGMQFAEIMLPHFQKAVAWLKDLTKWFQNLSIDQQESIIKWGLVAAAIGPAIVAGVKLITAIKGITSAVKVLGAALQWLTANPVGAVLAAIGLLIIAGVKIYQNWDKVKYYGLQAWGALKTGVLLAIKAIASAYEKLLGWMPVLGDKIRDAHAKITQAIEKERSTWGVRWEPDEGQADRLKGFREIEGVNTAARSAADAARNFRRLETAAADAGEETEDTGDQAKNTGNLLENMGGQAGDAAEKIREAWVGTTEAVRSALSTLRTQHETEMTYAEMEGNNVELLRLRHQQLNKELEVQKTVVASAREEIEKAIAAGVLEGETTEDLVRRIDELNQKLAAEELAQARLEKQIYDTNESIKTQGKEAKDLVAELNEVVNAYHIGLAQALEEYQANVKQTNEILRRDTEALQQELSSRLDEIASRGAERERQVTSQYEKELESRARSLMNFVGIFDEVTGREVSGETLLRNLEGQVSAFSDWQKNIQALSARGIDEGLLQELREMGPKAAPELAALNTLTDEQLSKYVELWKQRQKQAREEAVGQLSRQRDEMNRQLEEIRADTANQMEQQRQEIAQKLAEMQAQAKQELEKYKLEWEKKNEEIRKNTEKNIQDIHDRFSKLVGKSTDYGIELVDNFTSGMESRFESLRRTLENMASIVDSYMPHSPAKIGPLRRLDEYGPALVKGIVDGVAGAIPKLRSMAHDFAESLVPTSLGGISGGSGSHYSNNVVINVYTWDEAERALARLGVR